MTTDEAAFHYTFENTVRLEETDAQGIVFFGNYVTYQDEAVLAYWRELGIPYDEVLEADWEVFVVHTDLDFYASASFPEELRHGVRVSKLGTSSLTFAYRCERAADGTLLADGHHVQVAVDDAGQARPIPADLKDAIMAYQDVPPETN